MEVVIFQPDDCTSSVGGAQTLEVSFLSFWGGRFWIWTWSYGFNGVWLKKGASYFFDYYGRGMVYDK